MTVRDRWGLKPLVAGVMACLAMSSVQAFNDDLGPLGAARQSFEVGGGVPKAHLLDTLTFSLTAPVEGSFTIMGQGLVIPIFDAHARYRLDICFVQRRRDLTGVWHPFSGLNLLAG